MTYQVYITDGGDVVELDTENIDVKSIFSLLDITNIGSRKDNIRTLTFRGTKTNNNAFGSFFDLGRTTDFDLSNNLFFNYNPLKSVTAFVYEDSSLIFKGSLRLTEISVDATSNVIYNTIVTGSFIDLKTAIQDKYLTDLDFTDLNHNYNIGNITNSWTGTTNQYVYPNIDYGYYSTGFTTTVNDIDARNFKPAIKVKSYFDRIFNQDGLSGFTYEIKGSSDFKNMFNSLIVPDTQEGAKYYTSGQTTTYSMSAGTTVFGFREHNKLAPLNIIATNQAQKVAELYSTYIDVLEIKKNVNCGVNLNLTLSATNTNATSFNENCKFYVRIVKRNSETNNDPDSENWNVLSEYTFDVIPNTTVVKPIKLIIGSVDLSIGEQLAVQVFGRGRINQIFSPVGTPIYLYDVEYTITASMLTLPVSVITYNITPSRYSGNTITPIPPVNIKQIDFIKSIVNQFNFLVYTNNDNHKHIFFEQYDDFYVLAQPQFIVNNSLDWSSKIDYKSGFKIKSNLDLPKSYLFTNKTDIDYLTDNYKKKFNEVYGELTFDDSYGLLETKKVELIFSPTIITSETGTDRKYPLLYKVESGVKKPTKTNIRLAFYNGLQNCNNYTIYNDETTGGTTTHQTYYTGSTYPQISNYYLVSGTSQFDLNFSIPIEYYFSASDDYTSSPNSYSSYYINQISDLTNPNVTYVECNVLLNAIDISNLDLKVPVYINTGTLNGAYFKVLSVEYDGGLSTSKVLLQKIGF